MFTLNTCQFCMNFNSLEFYLKTLYRFTIQSKRLQRYHENYELYIFRNIVVSVHNYHENGVAHLGLVSKDMLVNPDTYVVKIAKFFLAGQDRVNRNFNDNFYKGKNFNELEKLLLELDDAEKVLNSLTNV